MKEVHLSAYREEGLAERAVIREAHRLARRLERGESGEILDELVAAVERHRAAKRKATRAQRANIKGPKR